jgi:hypothetical protein
MEERQPARSDDPVKSSRSKARGSDPRWLVARSRHNQIRDIDQRHAMFAQLSAVEAPSLGLVIFFLVRRFGGRRCPRHVPRITIHKSKRQATADTDRAGSGAKGPPRRGLERPHNA